MRNNVISKYVGKHKLRTHIDIKTSVKAFNLETGFKVSKAEMLRVVNEEIDRQRSISDNRRKVSRRDGVWNGRILNMQMRRKQNLACWNSSLEGATDFVRAQALSFKGEAFCRIRFGTDLLIVQSNSDTDWDYYSKAYGHPKVTISNRRVELHRFINHEQTLIDTFHLDTFAGNFLIKAVVYFYKLAPVKVPKELKSVQLNQYYSVHKLKDIAGVQLYCRTLPHLTIDYCAVQNGTTFHAPTMKESIQGLRAKNKTTALFHGTTIDYSVAKSFGFCDTGIRDFVAWNDLSIDGIYTRRELQLIVNTHDNCKYANELKKLGIRV